MPRTHLYRSLPLASTHRETPRDFVDPCDRRRIENDGVVDKVVDTPGDEMEDEVLNDPTLGKRSIEAQYARVGKIPGGKRLVIGFVGMAVLSLLLLAIVAAIDYGKEGAPTAEEEPDAAADLFGVPLDVPSSQSSVASTDAPPSNQGPAETSSGQSFSRSMNAPSTTSSDTSDRGSSSSPSALSSPAQPSSSPAADGAFKKKGTVYVSGSPSPSLFATDKKANYLAYNWASSPEIDLPSNVRFVPMMWDEKMLGTWERDAPRAIEAGATHFLGFNEGDIASQANMSPQDAAALWKRVMEPHKGRVKLVSPAVSNGVAERGKPPMGVAWLQAFLAACSDCQIDALAVHIYCPPSAFEYFKTHLTTVKTTFPGYPIWLTEWGLTADGAASPGQLDQDRKRFLEEAMDWLEQEDSIEAFFYFGVHEKIGLLVSADGSMTSLGEAYAAHNP